MTPSIFPGSYENFPIHNSPKTSRLNTILQTVLGLEKSYPSHSVQVQVKVLSQNQHWSMKSLFLIYIYSRFAHFYRGFLDSGSSPE